MKPKRTKTEFPKRHKVRDFLQKIRHLCIAFWHSKAVQKCLALCKRYALPTVCVFLISCIVGVGMLLCVSAAVRDKTAEQVRTADQVTAFGEKYDCILVLGCRVYADGTPSSMLYDRVSVASSLYLEGLADQVLMSGDSHIKYYDEVGCMKETAISLGVPEDAIATDAYGLSTYDSIARAVETYRGKRVLIVTQEYHLYRALYIAEKLGLDADGACADLRPYTEQFSRNVREVLARCKDVYYGLKQPPAAKPE